MPGLAFSNSAIVSWVIFARLSLPHQVKRSFTGSCASAVEARRPNTVDTAATVRIARLPMRGDIISTLILAIVYLFARQLDILVCRAGCQDAVRLASNRKEICPRRLLAKVARFL